MSQSNVRRGSQAQKHTSEDHGGVELGRNVERRDSKVMAILFFKEKNVSAYVYIIKTSVL